MQPIPPTRARAVTSALTILFAGLNSATPVQAADLKGCTLNATTTGLAKLFPTLCIDLETTGAKALKLSNSANALASSCAEWLKGRAGELSKEPVLNIAADMSAEGQPKISIGFAVYEYAGPGVYDQTKIRHGGLWPTAVMFGAYPDMTTFGLSEEQSDGTKPPNPGKATMDVKADGSVTLMMTGLSSPVQKSEADGGGFSHSDRMDAKITLRCVDPVK
jgi:hypothetical protein